MNKTKLKVVFANNPPDIYDNCRHFPTLFSSFQCPYPGRSAEILGMLVEYLNWEIEPIFMPSSPDGLVDYGSFNQTSREWMGGLGYLYRNEADTTILMFEYLEFRDEYSVINKNAKI